MKSVNLKKAWWLALPLATPLLAVACSSQNTNSEASENNDAPKPKTDVTLDSKTEEVVKSTELKIQYDAENDYYEAADGKSGKELWDALFEIQKTKRDTNKKYQDLPDFYLSSEAFKDSVYEKDNSVLDFYSENPEAVDPYTYAEYTKGKSGAKVEGEGLNREHIIPQSWFNKALPMVADANFVWPTDIKVNALRDNNPHGIVQNATTTTQNGGKLGTDSENEVVFEVIDEFKGDIARAYLYFALTYNDQSITNKNSIFTVNYPFIQDKYQQIYLNWHSNDKVSKWDIKRNHDTYNDYAQIRNPFIDYPELEKSLFGENPVPFVNKGVAIGVLENE
ncbi:endonuclease [Mycoplasma sp. Ms02]|uniref:endonuclease n=1 Tax=Mycoplasma sp. Ms02 TaxID=353851 RepID=UPI001C89EA22|nr:endonuclease [Mycoplasma sp. Ms02]QZE12396.1 endonuclease [Mycoplasma sp. Ms02]